MQVYSYLTNSRESLASGQDNRNALQVVMQFQKVSNSYFVVLFLGFLGLILYMIWPFVSAVLFAAILGGTFRPIYSRIYAKLHPDLKLDESLDEEERKKAEEVIKKKENMTKMMAGVITCVGIILLIFLPLIWMGINLSREAYDLYQSIQSTVSREWIDEIFFGDSWIAMKTKDLFASLQIDYNFETLEKWIVEGAKTVSLFVFETINSWLSNVFGFLFQFIIMMILIYTFLVHGPELGNFLFHLSPLPEDEEKDLTNKFIQMNYVTLVGNGLGGIIQGVLAGFGFWFAGIGSVLFWTTAMIILAFIPIVGISIIYIPACIYLLFHGDILAGILLFIYATGVSLVVENWFKPRFIGKSVEINSFVLFFSIVGGMAAFGMGGIFYGPLVVMMFLSFVALYFKKFSVDLAEEESLSEVNKWKDRRTGDRRTKDRRQKDRRNSIQEP